MLYPLSYSPARPNATSIPHRARPVQSAALFP